MSDSQLFVFFTKDYFHKLILWYIWNTVQQSLEKQEFRNLEFKRQQMENHWKTIRNFWQYYYYKKLDF